MNRKLLLSMMLSLASILGLYLITTFSPVEAKITASIIVFPTEGLITDEEGKTDTFTIVLDSAPSQPVKIDLESSDPTEGFVTPESANFTPGNWDTPQIFTVTGLPDAEQDGDVAYTIITKPAASNDPNFNGLDAPDVSVINLDNTVPIANDDVATTDEDFPVTIDVLTNDTGLDDIPLTVTIFSYPSHGNVVVNPNNTITYSPVLNFNGEDTFSYQVCDGDNDCANAGVTVTVNPINDPPTGNDDTTDTLLNTAVAVDVLTNDNDIDGDTLLLLSFDATSVSGGTISRIDSGTPEDFSDDQLQYTPSLDFLGLDTFNYTVSDGILSDNATVTISVTTEGTLVAIDDDYSVGQNEVLSVPTPGILENDISPSGLPLTAHLLSEGGPYYGNLDLLEDGSFTYTPDGIFIGVDTFTYQASDGVNTSEPATVAIEIIDQIPPSIEWISPGPTGGIYDVRLDKIELEVEATDNVHVVCVEFFRWDAEMGKFILLGTVCEPPYTIEIDPSSLNLGWNQMFARANDSADNWSDFEFIWLFRLTSVFLPFTAR
jgi:hypothetical protein